MKTIFKLFVITLLIGCSSLSKEDCANQNWFKLGNSDAMSGETKPKAAEYRRDCSEHDIQIKSVEYLKGFENGLKKHCTYHNGLYRGESGDGPHSLCEEVNPEYKKGYLEGFRDFKRQESIIELREELIEDNGGKVCSTSSDCMYEGSCSFGKCERSGNECSIDSDCEYEGSCDSVSASTDYMDTVSIDICKP